MSVIFAGNLDFTCRCGSTLTLTNQSSIPSPNGLVCSLCLIYTYCNGTCTYNSAVGGSGGFIWVLPPVNPFIPAPCSGSCNCNCPPVNSAFYTLHGFPTGLGQTISGVACACQ